MGLLEGDPFCILVNGAPVTKPILEGDDTVQASIIGSSEAAIFTYDPINGYLQSNGDYLGRNLIEDRSLLPKKLVWSSDPRVLLPVNPDENDSGKLRFSGGILIVMNGHLFASLMGEEEPSIEFTFL